jgi:hypothetical protein
MEPGLTISEWIRQKGSKFKSTSEAADACSAELHLTRKSFFNTLYELKKKGKVKPTTCLPDARGANLGLSEQELRSKHDGLYKLEQAVKTLMPGKFIPEPEFRATIATNPSQFRSKADLPQFDIYRGRTQGITYWGHPRDIKRMKDEGILQ